MFKKILLATIFIFLSTTSIAQAVGVSVTPSKILLNAQVNQPIKTQISIKNPSGVVGIYDVYPDEYLDIIKITPSSFTLEAGEFKTVELAIKPQTSEIFTTNISIVAQPLSPRDFQANSGLKVPLEVRVSESTQKSVSWFRFLTFTNIILGIDVILALILLGALLKKSKKHWLKN